MGSPCGVDEERRRLTEALERFNRHHGGGLALLFHAMAWEDRPRCRPQEIINADLDT
jgi:hypothetical protein